MMIAIYFFHFYTLHSI